MEGPILSQPCLAVEPAKVDILCMIAEVRGDHRLKPSTDGAEGAREKQVATRQRANGKEEGEKKRRYADTGGGDVSGEEKEHDGEVKNGKDGSNCFEMCVGREVGRSGRAVHKGIGRLSARHAQSSLGVRMDEWDSPEPSIGGAEWERSPWSAFSNPRTQRTATTRSSWSVQP
jgi:hypothetical protein